MKNDKTIPDLFKDYLDIKSNLNNVGSFNDFLDKYEKLGYKIVSI